MPIAWLIFHDFGIIVIVLVHKKKKKKEPNSIKAKVVILKKKIDGFSKKCSMSTAVGILEETNKDLTLSCP